MGDDDGSAHSRYVAREKERMKKRSDVEEELFIRVPLSKFEKKRQNAQKRAVGAMAQVRPPPANYEELPRSFRGKGLMGKWANVLCHRQMFISTATIPLQHEMSGPF